MTDGRTRDLAVAALGEDRRVWPWWVERQRHAGSGQVRLSDPPGRRWTGLGTVGSAARAVVDPCGLLTPVPGGWSVDWWIRAEDRWHVPSREASTRQRLVDAAAVVETTMRVPGGDVASRSYAAVLPGIGDAAVMEVHNRAAVPVVVAWAVRPYSADALAVVHRVELDDRAVLVDGCVGLLLPGRPRSAALAGFRTGDVVGLLEEGGDDPPARSVTCPDGLAEAAFVFPVPHSTSVRLVAPLVRERRRRRAVPVVAPPSSAVVRGWAAHARHGARLELPAGRLADAAAANRVWLSLAAEAEGLSPGPRPGARFDFRTAFDVVAALDALGLHGDTRRLLTTWPARQRRAGTFGEADPGAETGAAIAALADHWRLTRDGAIVEDALPAVARAVRALGRSDGPWALRGLDGAAELLRAWGQTHVAETADASAARLRSRPVAAPLTAARLGLLPAGDPAVGAALASLEQDGAAVVATGGGRDVGATLDAAALELARGDPFALRRLQWVVDHAGPTLAWPDVVTDDGGSAREGHDGRAAALFLTLLRRLTVRCVRGGDGVPSVALCTLLPDGWRGHGIEVHGAPTELGTVSFAVRWHGDRPALLWRVQPAPGGAGAVRIVAPGLNATWSTTDTTGEALL